MNQVEKRPARPTRILSLPKVTNHTIVEQATTTLRNDIMRGRYSPGQHLVEADLINELNISRGSVRTVLRRLESDGLVTIESYRGAIVVPLSRESLRYAFQVREVIEGLAARLAAERVNNREIPLAATKKKLLEWAKTNAGGLDVYMERNTRFHHYIAELSGNPNLIAILKRMQLPARRAHFPIVLNQEAIDVAMAEHFEIVDAICSGDGVQAERLMRRHLRRSAKLSKNLPSYLFSGSSSSTSTK